MAMTAQVKAELASTQITKTCCRKAEVASMLRFAGGLHIVSGRIVVEAELDTGAAARRLRKDISEVYGHPSDVVMVQGNGIRKGRPARPARSPRARPASRRRERGRL
jgi:DNA-binding protein WhiA